MLRMKRRRDTVLELIAILREIVYPETRGVDGMLERARDRRKRAQVVLAKVGITAESESARQL